MSRLIFIFLIFINISFAHKLNVFTNYENKNLFISTYFANGNPCKNCEVRIVDLDNKLIEKNKTNVKGEFEYKIDESKFIVRVNAGSGHIQSSFVSRTKSKSKESLVDNIEVEELKKENQRLKEQVLVLEKKLDILEIFKILFALLIIYLIFLFLKKIKK